MVCITHPKNGKVISTFQIPNDEHLESVALSRAPTLVAAGTVEGKLFVWDLNSSRQLRCFDFAGGVIKLLWHKITTKMVLTAACLDGTVQVWNVGTGSSKVLSGHTNHVLDFQTTQEDTRVVTASEDGTCLVFDTTDLYTSV